jgi:hypothetical protein
MGIDKGILSALADHEEKIKGPHFLLCAEKPLHPQNNELKLSHDQVLNHLCHAGFDAHGIKTSYGKPSRSIIIYQVTPETAEDLHALASKLGQGHSIYSTGDAHEMRFHHGAYAQRSHYGNNTVFHDIPPTDNFHSLPGGSCHFDHVFDFKSHHLAGQLDKWSNNGRT